MRGERPDLFGRKNNLDNDELKKFFCECLQDGVDGDAWIESFPPGVCLRDIMWRITYYSESWATMPSIPLP